MKIGITQFDYPIIRNILDKVPDLDYIKLRKNNNFFHTLSTIYKVLFKKKLNIEGQYFFYQKPKIDVLHLYNEINYSSQKWVTTFETLVPRFAETKNDHQNEKPKHTKNKKTERALKTISKKNCLGIISISDCNVKIMQELLNNYANYTSEINDKMYVLHPPQEVINRNNVEFYKNLKNLTFIFVGNEFHRKGGVEMYQVLKKLSQKYQFKLIIISSFKTDHYVTKVTETEAMETRARLEKEEWIDIFDNIPNSEVLNLIKSSHIGLLPTWSDTYGFSVLEMQAVGVPVITTDIRALPEINNSDCGWMINLPQNKLKQALYFSDEQKEALKATLKMQMESILVNIFENPNQLIEKSNKSVERIIAFHNPDVFAEKLNTIYNKR